MRRLARVLMIACAAIVAAGPGFSRTDGAATPPSIDDAAFWSLVSRMSEGAGQFRPTGGYVSDNLVSNERSFQQPMSRLTPTGDVYIGVGPEQNFSYIAQLEPSIAFIVDVRRDNLLLHLLFKALFDQAATRVEYLSLLVGRATPPGIDGWRDAPIDRIVGQIDRAPRVKDLDALRTRVAEAVKRSGVALSADDLATVARFHQRFIDDGLDLQFNSAGRAPREYYPTYRDLLRETDAEGRQANYLASDEAFQYVRDLQQRGLVIPVVGDLSGPTTLAAVGRLIAARRETLSALYASNVEFYLYGQGTFPRFAGNLRQIPHDNRSVIIRSVFGRYLGIGRPADVSTSQLDSVSDLLDAFGGGRLRSYGELVSRKDK